MDVNKKDSFMIKSSWFQMKVLQHNFDGRDFRHANHTRGSAGSRKCVNWTVPNELSRTIKKKNPNPTETVFHGSSI